MACLGRLASGERAILAGSGGTLQKVIAAGDPLFGSTVSSLSEPGSHGLNNSGQIVFTYSLESGVEGLAIATPTGAPPTPRPRLDLERLDPSRVRLAWPTNAADFHLEAAASLPPGGWTPVTNTPVVEGGRVTVTLEMQGAPQFFRLHKP